MSIKSKLLTVSGAIAMGMVASPAAAEGWYAGGFIGAVSPEDVELSPSDDLSIDTTAIFGGVLGTHFGENVRVEAEASFFSGDGDCPGKCGAAEFEVSVLSILGNVWIDIPAELPLTPYVGGGLGMGHLMVDSDAVGDADEWGLAYQVGFGGRFGSGNAHYDIGYRYKGLNVDGEEFFGEDIEGNAHVVQFGANFDF